LFLNQVVHRTKRTHFCLLWHISWHIRQYLSKVQPKTGREGKEGEKYSSTLSLTLALDCGGWSTPWPGRLTPGKETNKPSTKIVQRLGELQGQSRTVRKCPPRSQSVYRLSYPGPPHVASLKSCCPSCVKGTTPFRILNIR